MRLYLEVIEGPHKGEKFSLSEKTSFGRKGSNIQLDDVKLSGIHVFFDYSQETGWLVIDNKSRNGVWINGLKEIRAVLKDGDEILIGREDPVSGVFPDVDLTPHGGEEGGVSRRHARIFVEGGAYFIEDLDSTNFTFVNKQKLAPKTRQALNDGDEIRCGRVALVLKTS